jgi:hypothetical protein
MEPDVPNCLQYQARLLQALPELVFGNVRVFGSPCGLGK